MKMITATDVLLLSQSISIAFLFVLFFKRSFQINKHHFYTSILSPLKSEEFTKWIILTFALNDIATSNSSRTRLLFKCLFAASVQVPPLRGFCGWLFPQAAPFTRQIFGPVYLVYTLAACGRIDMSDNNPHVFIAVILSTLLACFACLVCRPDCNWTNGWLRPCNGKAKRTHGVCMQISTVLHAFVVMYDVGCHAPDFGIWSQTTDAII